MTQALSGRPLRLQITPMQVPEAVAPAGLALDAIAPAMRELDLNLLLRPGEPTEMLVQLENTGSRLLQIGVQVEGSFPPSWCVIGMEGHDLAPHQRMDAVLRFQIPDDFFENQQALRPGDTLRLNYQGRLYVYSTEVETQRQEVETAVFNLNVRPSSLYLDFLPAIYREVDFVGRFLNIFEQTFEPTVETLNTLWAYLDPLLAPQAMLPFLSHWVAWEMDPRIGGDRQRHLIRYAMELYRWRGTRRGLRLFLHLYTDLPLDDELPEDRKHISIEELFGEGFTTGEVRIGREARLGGGRPFHFIVRLRCDADHQIDEPLVRSIIEQEKPAFCTYELYIEQRQAQRNSPIALSTA
ncbi:MAG TPA: phage tail protein [Crinalium sp.]|jgi:phage tail-like protein